MTSKPILACAILWGALSQCCQSSSAQTAPDQLRQLLAVEDGERGIEAFDVGDYDKAISLFTLSINNCPHRKNYAWRGKTYMRMEDFSHAVLDFTEAIEHGDDSSYVYLSRAQAYYELGKYIEAEADSDRAMDYPGDRETALLLRGMARQGIGNYDKAIEDFSEALSQNAESTAALLWRALAQMELEEYGAAKDDLSQAIELEPGEGSCYMLRAICWYELDQTCNAIGDVAMAVVLEATQQLLHRRCDSWLEPGAILMLARKCCIAG